MIKNSWGNSELLVDENRDNADLMRAKKLFESL